MKRICAIVLLFLACAGARAQTDNTFYAKQYNGVTVGQKVSQAMLSCNSNTLIPCIIVLDPSLAAWPAGTMPSLCAQCSLSDLRTGAAAVSFPGVTGDGASGLKVTGNVQSASNESTAYLLASAGDLGAQITAAITAGYTNIKLTPSGSYSMTTQVTNAGPGVFIDCQGSTINATFTMGPLIEWSALSIWATESINAWVNSATGIAHCKIQPFTQPTAATNMYVGQVIGISHFTATDITVQNGGAFQLEGPSILGVYDGVRVVNPTTQLVWDLILGGGGSPPSGWFGPNANQCLNCYVESVEGLYFAGYPVTAFEADSGSMTIEGSYVEGLGLVFHTNGGSLAASNDSVNMRTTPGQILQMDCSSPPVTPLACGGFSANGLGINWSDNASNLDSGFVFNIPPWIESGYSVYQPVFIANLSLNLFQNASTRPNIFTATQPTTLNLTGSTINIQAGSIGPNIFAATGAGSFELPSITGNVFNANGGTITETTYFSASGGSYNVNLFLNGTISNNSLYGLSNILGLESTVYSGNMHLNSNPAVTFTQPGTFTGNYFGNGPGTLTLDGSQGGGNYALTDNEFEFSVGGNVVIPYFLNGYHGSATYGTRVQLSNGNGAAGDCPYFLSDGSLGDSGSGCASGTSAIPNLSFYGTAQPAYNAVTATATGSGVLNDQYAYQVYYETVAGGGYLTNPGGTVVTPASQQVALTTIPISSDPAVIARVICRVNLTTGGGAPLHQLLTTINNNVTTTYTDNTPDASLTTYCPWTASGFAAESVGGLNSGNPIFEIGNSALFLGQDSAAGYADTAVGGNNMPGCAGCIRSAAYGFDALLALVNGQADTGVGVHACDSVTSGGEDFCGGYIAGSGITTGSFDIAIGSGSANSAAASNDIVAIGQNSFYYGTAISGDVGLGYEAGQNCLGVGLTAVGSSALNCGASATGASVSAFGSGSFSSETTGNGGTGVGYQSCFKNTSGANNTCIGPSANYSNVTSSNSFAGGVNALYANLVADQTAVGAFACANLTTGGNNLCGGFQAGDYISGGSTANQTSSDSVYLGWDTYALANGDTNEGVYGYAVTGNGSNTETLGNPSTVGTYFQGTIHTTSGAPTASAGTITGANAGGSVSGLSAATTLTLTFANGGWNTWASCTGNTSVSATQPYVSAISKTAVTFTFPSLTGTLYYQCSGN